MIRKRNICFAHNENAPKQILESVSAISSQISPIVISHKNFKEDYIRIINGIQDVCRKNGIFFSQKIVYSNNELHTILTHHDSKQEYVWTSPLLVESRALKVNPNHSPEDFIKCQALLNVLGIPTQDEDSCSITESEKTASIYKFSYTDIRNFKKCAPCFVILKKHNKKKPYNEDQYITNNYIDDHTKLELSAFRKAHLPYMPLPDYNGRAIPFEHKDITQWINSNFGQDGIRLYDKKRNVIHIGVPDDVWINDQGKLIVVDIKLKKTLNIDDARMQISWYATILDIIGYPIMDHGYILHFSPENKELALTETYGQTHPDNLATQVKTKLTFSKKLVPIKIDNSWIKTTLDEMMSCLNDEKYAKAYKEVNHQSCFSCDSHDLRESILNPPASPTNQAEEEEEIPF